MSVFERYLTLWVALCMVAGIALGQLLPAPFRALGAAEAYHVNLPVAVLIWLMIIPGRRTSDQIVNIDSQTMTLRLAGTNGLEHRVRAATCGRQMAV